jgi:uncharacterized Tic20 family protein
MTTLNPSTPDDRIMAALSHAAILIPTIGIVAPIVIWVTQKEKSKYVAFQSLQALAFQISLVLLWLVGMGCYLLSILGVFSSSLLPAARPGMEDWGIVIPLFVFGLIFLGAFIFLIYGIVAAVMAFQGKPFRYLLIGNMVERFLQQS